MNDISVSRYSFFDGDKQILRFAEYAPHKDDCDPICNCTKHVAKRPDGNPKNVIQHIIYEPEIKRRNIFKTVFNLTSGSLTLKWPFTDEDRTKIISPFASKEEREASFYFGMNQHSVKIGMSVPGYGYTDYAPIDLYMGSKIDTRRFVNGWKPTNFTNIETIDDNAIWIHRDHYGNEMLQFIEGNEAELWRNTFLKMELLSRIISRYQVEYYDSSYNRPSLTNETLSWPVGDVLKSINEVPVIKQIADEIIEHCSLVTERFACSDLFIISKIIDAHLFGEAYINGIRHNK